MKTELFLGIPEEKGQEMIDVIEKTIHTITKEGKEYSNAEILEACFNSIKLEKNAEWFLFGTLTDFAIQAHIKKQAIAHVLGHLVEAKVQGKGKRVD